MRGGSAISVPGGPAWYPDRPAHPMRRHTEQNFSKTRRSIFSKSREPGHNEQLRGHRNFHRNPSKAARAVNFVPRSKGGTHPSISADPLTSLRVICAIARKLIIEIILAPHLISSHLISYCYSRSHLTLCQSASLRLSASMSSY